MQQRSQLSLQEREDAITLKPEAFGSELDTTTDVRNLY